mgnify:CR=1 FL=1
MIEQVVLAVILLAITLYYQCPGDLSAVFSGLVDSEPKQYREPDPKHDNLMFKKGGGDAPSPDPNVGKAALKNAQVGEDWLKFAEEQFEVANERQQDIDKITKRIGEQQIETQDRANDWSQEDRARWEGTFRPIEDRLISDARDWDSDERQSREAGEARADVMQGVAGQREQRERQMASMGIDPRSGRYAGTGRADDIRAGVASAGAQNNARRQVRGQGMALRADAANMGRGLPSQAASGAALGLNAGNSAIQGSLNAAQNERANTNIMNQGFQGAMSGYQSQAGILNNQYQNQLAGWQAQTQADAAGAAGLGGAIGTLGGAAMTAWGSSKDSKTDKSDIPDGEALQAVKGLDVESWRYKDGQKHPVTGELLPADKRHVGPYAEDFKKQTGFGDGKTIDPISAMGITMKAVQDLDKKLEDRK